ncbi:MAG: AAA family ATPase, partial [Candidatus Colwellbacteria bacterium]|nr:AAA family ATPase [Candidatus Colwellbacteria bacterium]
GGERGKSARVKEIDQKLEKLRERHDKLAADWQSGRRVIEKLQTLRRRIEDLRHEAEVAERDGNFERVAQIRYGELPQAEKECASFERKQGGKSKKGAAREEVSTADVARVIARWTGIPMANILETEADKLVRLEEDLSKRVVGQEEAIKTVANALRRARAGLSDPNRPYGSFLFLGPTGVGKTELARALAALIFNKEDALVRVDMSEYMERHAVSRLIGSPPGYVGYEEGGTLTEAIRHRPYSLILFDEIEKAHPEVFNILLQMLDAGRLTDNRGKAVNFKNTIIILTSNIGSDLSREVSQLGFRTSGDEERQAREEEYRANLKEALRDYFRPEFLNRLDDIIIFNPLGKEEVLKIVDIQIEAIRAKLAEKGIKVAVDAVAREHIAEKGFDPEFGARPIKRLIQKVVLDRLADRIIRGELKHGQKVTIGLENSEIAISV